MRITLLLAAALLSLTVSAQSNFLLGYQEFPTTITGQSSDASGNRYYTGFFKGQLTVNGQVLTNGNGLEDIFWVKTNPAGQVLKHLVWGTGNSDISAPDGLAKGEGDQMYLIVRGFDGLSIGGNVLAGYATPTAPPFANGIVSLDTGGRVKWLKRTNVTLIRLYSANNLVHAVAGINPSNGAVKVGDDIVLDSVGKSGLVYFVFDTTGQLLGTKTILTRKFLGNQVPFFHDLKRYSDGSLLFTLRMSGDSSFMVNGTTIPLPNSVGNYELLIRTDTSFTGIRTKLLNPGNQVIFNGSPQVVPQYLAASDSVYMVLQPIAGSTLFIDGLLVSQNQNSLVVLDSSLKARRVTVIAPGIVASYPNTSKRRISYRNILLSGSELYFTGSYAGINEAPMTAVTPRDTLATIIGTTKLSVDLNGPSKSFVARADLGLQTSRAAWYGDHREYENTDLMAYCLRLVNGQRLSFVQAADNVWNPWVIDTSLAVLTGSMKRNADRPETPQLVSFFPDGSRLVQVLAQGKTALDTGYVRCNALRRDLFLANFNQNGTVRWSTRIASTLFQPSARKMLMKGNAVWLLANFSGSMSDSNFIEVAGLRFQTGFTSSLLARIDANGTIVPLNLQNNLYSSATIMDFSFFSNGDLALLTNYNLNLPGFSPSSNGFYLLRVNVSSGAIAEARKLTSTLLPNLNSIEVDSRDRIYLSGMAFPTPLVNPKLYLYNGLSVTDSIPMVTSSSGSMQVYLLQMEMSKFNWYKRTFGNGGAVIRGLGNLHLVNDRPLLMISSQYDNQPLNWETTPLHNGAYAGRVTFVGLNDAGTVVRSRVVPGFNRTSSRLGSNGKILLSGSLLNSATIDTIQIGNAGLTDALGLVLDSSLVAKRSFRLGSSLYESMTDMDIYHDSLAAFSFFAQTTPTLFLNRAQVLDSDFDEDAYVSTSVLGNGVITATPDPVAPGNYLRVAPNPISGRQLRLQLSSPRSMEAMAHLYAPAGQCLGSVPLRLLQGERSYTLTLPGSLPGGIYYVQLKTAQGQETRSFLVR